MENTAAIITAFVALVSVLITVYTAVNSATRSELADLRGRVDKLRRENNRLWAYVDVLVGELRKHEIEVPPMPDIDGEE
jgi:hypothetical protein